MTDVITSNHQVINKEVLYQNIINDTFKSNITLENGNEVTTSTSIFFNNGILNMNQTIFNSTTNFKKIFPLFDFKKKKYEFYEDHLRDEFHLPSLVIKDNDSKETIKFSFPSNEDLSFTKNFIEEANSYYYQLHSKLKKDSCLPGKFHDLPSTIIEEWNKMRPLLYENPIVKWDGNGNCVQLQLLGKLLVRKLISKMNCLKEKKLISLKEWGTGAPKVSVVTKSELSDLFWQIVDERVVPYHYKKDYCYSRSFYLGKYLESKDIISGNLFTISQDPSKLLKTKDDPSLTWGYHVAPFVAVYDETLDKIVTYVIDPTINPETPLLDKIWIQKISNDERDQSHLKTYYRDRHIHLFSDLKKSPLEAPTKGQDDLAKQNLIFMENELFKLQVNTNQPSAISLLPSAEN